LSAAEKIVGARQAAVPSDNRQAAVSGGNRRAQTAIGVHRQQAAGALILAEWGAV
jgi:hypothetical protein